MTLPDVRNNEIPIEIHRGIESAIKIVIHVWSRVSRLRFGGVIGVPHLKFKGVATVLEFSRSHFAFPSYRKGLFIRKFCIGILRAQNNFGFFVPNIIINVFNGLTVNEQTDFYFGGSVFNDFERNNIPAFSVDGSEVIVCEAFGGQTL